MPVKPPPKPGKGKPAAARRAPCPGTCKHHDCFLARVAAIQGRTRAQGRGEGAPGR